MIVRLFVVVIGLLASPVPAQADDADALMLADTAPGKVQTASDLQWYGEFAAGRSTQRDANAAANTRRLSLDMRLDSSIAPGWRGVLADRLDVNWPASGGGERSVNTLKEAYLSWQAQDNYIVDIGRINAPNGVATGYNPTDFLRAQALRSIVSVDPSSLKKNRLGSVMLRGQTLWSSGSLTALFAPKLAERASDADFSLDLGATNHADRWLLLLSQRFSDDFNPQWLIYGETHQSPQLGFNLTRVLGDAVVAFVEWSGGRSRTQWSQALGVPENASFHQRLATGATYTAANKLSLTLEYAYAGAALDATAWNALQRGAPAAYGLYRNWVQSALELPTKQVVTVYANWPDAIARHLDLSAMLRFNLADKSRLNWFEARYRWEHVDLALQWQVNSGNRGSEFGTLPLSRAWQLSLRNYF